MYISSVRAVGFSAYSAYFRLSNNSNGNVVVFCLVFYSSSIFSNIWSFLSFIFMSAKTKQKVMLSMCTTIAFMICLLLSLLLSFIALSTLDVNDLYPSDIHRYYLRIMGLYIVQCGSIVSEFIRFDSRLCERAFDQKVD